MAQSPTSDAPNVTSAVPFFRVADMATSLRFYADGLGFRVARKWEPDGQIRWCWLELGSASLMLQTRGEALAGERLGVGVSVSFMCRDALAIHAQAVARGLSPREPFVGNGLWVTGFTDPDGYMLEFESPTEVAEDSTLAQWREAGRT